jgi:hypothetical protein
MVNIHTRTHILTYIHTYMHMHTTHTHACVCRVPCGEHLAKKITYIDSYIGAHIHTRTHTYTYIHTHKYTYTHTYIHTHTDFDAGTSRKKGTPVGCRIPSYRRDAFWCPGYVQVLALYIRFIYACLRVSVCLFCAHIIRFWVQNS